MVFCSLKFLSRTKRSDKIRKLELTRPIDVRCPYHVRQLGLELRLAHRRATILRSVPLIRGIS